MNYKPTQLLFIDATVDDIETLLQGTLPGIEAHILSSEQDGVAQISQILQEHPEVKTVHIVSHGSPGCLYLGNSQLSLDTLNIYSSQLQSWSRDRLTLMLYGCNVAAGDAGEEFVNKLHQLTGANIAASGKLTGNAALGGNWQLEVAVGEVTTVTAFTQETMATYVGVLPGTYTSQSVSTAFQDISVTGTSISGASQTVDDLEYNQPLPFNFNFYGVNYNQVRVVDNGALIFANTGEIDYINQLLPTSNLAAPAILPFWDDLYGGKIYYQTLGSPGSRQFVIQWTQPHFSGTNNTVNFEVILYEGSNNIDFVYQDVLFGDTQIDSGQSATVGIQENSTNALQYSYNTSSLSNGQAIRFIKINNPPTLNTPTGISYTDTANDDTFTAQTGTLTATDPDSGQTLTYGITGGTVSGTTITKIGTYGTLILDTSTRAYSYTPNDSAIEALSSNATESFTFTVSDGTATDSKTLAINLTGTNDIPFLNLTITGDIIDTANDDTFGNRTGTLGANDRDSGQTLTFGISGGTVSDTTVTKTGTYGTLTLNSSTGFYTFVPNDSAIEALTSNTTQDFTITVNDGNGGNVSKIFSRQIIGANDTPTLNTPTDISYTDTANDDTFTAQTGTLTATDRDSGQTLTCGITGGIVSGTTITKIGTYGTLILDSSTRAYSYTPNDSAIEALSSNTAESFTFTVSDGTATDSKTLAINLTGANDTPVITPATFTIPENSANSIVVGTLTGSDVEGNSLSNWTITGGNTNLDGDANFAFAINSTTGQITVNDSGDLDFKTQAQFNLQVTVSDGSATSNAANVTINLLKVQKLTPGNDVGYGTSGNDIIDAQDGDDRLYGFAGNDTILSGIGADIAYGGDGNDSIDGGDGNDRLYGDSGNDTLLGGAGADILYGGAGDDLLNGGLGSDRYYGEGGIDTFVIGSGQGTDSIYGYEQGIDKILVLGSTNIVEKKSGSNLLITSGTEILATLYNVAPGQISYIPSGQPQS